MGAALAACGDHGGSVVDAEPPAPTVQGRQIRFAPDHPQLRLLPLTAAAPGTSTPGVVVPAAAVMLHGARHSVLVEVQPGVFESRDVRVAHLGASEVAISHGLAAGELVVSDNALLLARELCEAQRSAAIVTGPDDPEHVAASALGSGKP
ncbi:membrane fusion protein cluster 2 protein [Variovorax sp. SRS16]|nr:membrane fusion protein cluster 2 protein [Variovorax sp. SRS16]